MPTIKDKLGMSFKTIVEMLQDRGACSTEELEYLRGFGANELAALCTKGVITLDIGTRIRIMYYLNKFKMADFKPLLERCADFDLCILIVGDKLTTTNTNHIAEFMFKMNSDSQRVELHTFEMAEVLFNITHHKLVPKHEVIASDEEINALVKRYNLKSKHQFPVILKSDPVARYFGLKPGQLVRITRTSPSAAEYTVYRCCV